MEIKPIFKGENILPIVFAFNDEYSKYFSVALQSLIDNSNKDYNYDIIIFTSSIRQRNKNLLENMLPDNFKIRFFDVADFVINIFNKKVKSSNYWSVEMYYRMIIPIVMRDYEKVLYLDSDIVCNSDVKDIFQIDFNKKQILVVSDTFNIVSKIKDGPKREIFNKKVLKLDKEDCYFNSGVLLFNNKNIDTELYIETVKETVKIKKPYCPDQDMLNFIFKDKTICIDYSWNFQYHIPIFHKDDINSVNKSEYEKYCIAFNNPKIIHYTSAIKPWNSPREEFAEYFWRYARKTEFYEEILYELNKSQIQRATIETNLYAQLVSDKRILLWGASIFLKEFLDKYNISGKNIIGIIDIDTEKQGKIFEGYNIYNPMEIKNLNPDKIIITVINNNDYKSSIQNFLDKNNINIELISIK